MRRVARVGAWAVPLATATLVVTGATMLLVSAARSPELFPVHIIVPQLYDVPLALAFGGVSLVIVRRVPAHPIGWLCGLVGSAIGFMLFANGYASWGPRGTVWVLWLWNVVAGPVLFGLALALLVFPSGRVPSVRWRWLARLLWLYVAAAMLVAAVAPWPLEATLLEAPVQERLGGWPPQNPIGWAGQAWLIDAHALVVPVGVLLLVASTLTLVPRWCRSVGDERQQIRWLGLAALLFAVEIALGLLQELTVGAPVDPVAELVGNAVFTLTLATIPVAIGLGIVRYRLYDIDAIVSRTIAYGGLATFIGLTYVAGVVLAGELVGRWAGSSTVPAVAATAVIAAAFHPLRVRLQAAADRWVYGERAAPYELMARFAHELDRTVAPPQVLARIAETAGQAARADGAQVTARMPDGGVMTATWPPDSAARCETMVAVHDDGTEIAEIAVAGAGTRATDVALLEHTAAVSTGALRNLRLLAELESVREAIERDNRELAASKARMVAAADEERRWLGDAVVERLDPGLDRLRHGLRRLSAATGPASMSHDCERLGVLATDLVEEMRALSRGVLPPVLMDHGIAAALRALVRRTDHPVGFELAPSAVGIRFPEYVETTVYLCCRAAIEAPAASGHARGHAMLRLWRHDRALAFSVVHPSLRSHSDRLTALADRVTSLGGQLTISPGAEWSTVVGSVPLDPDAFDPT